MQTLRGLERSGIVAFSEEEDLRVPPPKDLEPGPPIVLNEEQEAAFRQALDRILTAGAEKNSPL